MLQTLLQNCIPAMENAATAMLPLAMLLALSGKIQAGNLKKLIWQGVLWGILGAFFIATVKLGTKNAVKREVFELLVVIVALAGEFLLLASYWLGNRMSSAVKNKLLAGTTCLVAVTFALYHGLDLFLFPADVYASADTLVNAAVLIKFAGFIAGILLALLTGLAVFRAADALSYKAILTVFTIQFTAIILKQIILVIQIMMARRILLGGKALMSVMVPLINHHIWLLYLVLIVALSLPIALFLQKKPARPAGSNPAQYRKILIAVRKKLRWGTVVTLSILALFLLSTVGKTYADKVAEIVPAVPVSAQQGQVRIPLEKVEDGHLHRYSFAASTGTIVRFIIIKKGGSAYGVGLDACEICGPTGYFERDDQVVCKLCDVVMNKATIGFKGGCNPIPLEYKVDEGSILIPAAALEKEKERFR
jgi:uncharacterized membrane protein